MVMFDILAALSQLRKPRHTSQLLYNLLLPSDLLLARQDKARQGKATKCEHSDCVGLAGGDFFSPLPPELLIVQHQETSGWVLLHYVPDSQHLHNIHSSPVSTGEVQVRPFSIQKHRRLVGFSRDRKQCQYLLFLLFTIHSYVIYFD